jgi:hypothetical protein
VAAPWPHHGTSGFVRGEHFLVEYWILTGEFSLAVSEWYGTRVTGTYWILYASVTAYNFIQLRLSVISRHIIRFHDFVAHSEYRRYSSGSKVTGTRCQHSPTSNTEFKNTQRFISSPSYVLTAWCTSVCEMIYFLNLKRRDRSIVSSATISILRQRYVIPPCWYCWQQGIYNQV